MVEEGQRDAFDCCEPRAGLRIRRQVTGTAQEQQELRTTDRMEQFARVDRWIDAISRPLDSEER